MGFPTKQVEILTSRPTIVDSDVFDKGIPLPGTESQMRAIILYAPTLQIIGSLDNTNSDAETAWSRSVTVGFTFSTSETLSVSTSLEADAVFVKGSVTVTTTLTFSQEWSKSVTETMVFSVPAGKKTFMYQGYIWSEIAVYQNQQYSWAGERARCLTNVLATTREPLPVG
ncbi:hypothetical protein [Streptoalloteichus hindustanus]|uniref:Uncharacterized protein n=1 Tax=Streptoalloteichus hindustanus TaxID=2017 RepID=A0A1M5P2J3_STRHI|nr:hypothetical protein [Streptoalloteichus hindustanus]SHG95968.1 hypothetical protein SAMN05444320_11747 [Streptoalloteichus hindustanus]